MKKFLNGLFVFMIAALFIGGIAKAIINPVDINEYENRYAEKLTLPGFSTYLSGEFQEKTESALADQVIFAIDAKEKYNTLFSKFNKTILDRVIGYVEANAEPEPEKEIEEEIPEFKTIDDPNARYYKLPSGRLVLKDHLMYATRFLDGEQAKLDKRIANINECVERYSNIDFYIYYVEKETDIDFVTGERSNIYEYIRDNVNIEEKNVNRFNVRKFEDFDKWFYRTDHHLNCVGGLECYKQVLAWLLPNEQPLEPTGGPYEIGYYSGSKATGTDSQEYKDINSCYTYDYPHVDTWENGSKVNYYGSQDYYLKQLEGRDEIFSSITYGQLFGQDYGEIRFENPEKDTGSILVFGESMDNTILRLLSSHYSKMYSIDLRNYAAQMGKSFNLESYLAEHSDIDKILLIGNLDFFVLEAFNLK